jgi:hypothetical protein
MPMLPQDAGMGKLADEYAYQHASPSMYCPSPQKEARREVGLRGADVLDQISHADKLRAKARDDYPLIRFPRSLYE